MSQPKVGHIKYTTLISDIEKGAVKIPQFQRQFVWSKEQSATLIDSILKGYPIGTFIMWKSKEVLRSLRNIGHIDLPEIPEGDFVYYVLDGQQRMTSIFASLRGAIITREDGKREDFSEIYIDLTANEDEQIVITSIEGRNENSYIKLTEILNGDIFDLVIKYDKDAIKKISTYSEIIKTYEFSVITVDDVPIDVATEIFTRINVGGKHLTVFEIMCAKTYDHRRGFDLSDKYNELIERLQTVNYETIQSSTVLQAVSTCLVGECAKKNILKLDKEIFIDKWDEIINSLEHAIDYFRGYYRIPVSQLLPYDSLVIPFTYFFYKNNNKKPTGDMQKYLEDYFWRTVLNSKFSSGTESKVARDIIVVIDRILNNLEPEQQEVNISLDNLSRNGGFSVGKAYIKGMLCILAAKQPESFIDGALVNINNGWLKAANSKNYHHFFPRAYLRKNGIDDAKANHIANITIVDDFLNKNKIRDKAPSVYMAEFKELNSSIEDTMKTHLMDDINNMGIFNDDYNIFFEKRLETFKREIESRLIIKSYDIL